MNKNSMNNKTILLLTYCSILIWLDQITKYIFFNLQTLSQKFIFYPLINEWISWWIKLPMTLIIFISILCISLFLFLLKKKYISNIEFILLISWTFWNLIDRLLFNCVRDFISIWNFPVFNLADTFLTCWVLYILSKEFFNLNKNPLQTK